MKEFKVDITPENFPATRKALADLMEAIFEDAKGYTGANGLPPVAQLSIMSALCIEMKREIDVQLESLNSFMQTEAPNIEVQHVTVAEDGTLTPLLQPMPTARPEGHLN